MIVYIPTPITSAEQAEALPEGTVVRHDAHMPLEKWRDEYGIAYWGYHEEALEVDALVGWTALVPVEAHTQDHAPSPGWGEHVRRHRYVTEWITKDPTESAGEKVE